MPTKSDRQTNEQQGLLEIAQSYLREVVAPQAGMIDGDTEALKAALQGMGSRALLALRVPQHWGGAEWDEPTFRHFSAMVPRYSGALAFLQTQHQSAASVMAASSNESLKREYLPRMGTGEVLVGVGFSQLRRQGEPPMKATPVEGGYQLEGKVPWITGLGSFDQFIIGATLPDGQAVYGIMPFGNARQESGGSISFSEPMQLAAMASTNTVSANVSGWFLESANILSIKPAYAIRESDKKNVLHHGFFALGCARAGLDILETAYPKKQLSFLHDTYEALNEELTNCRTAMFEALPPESCSFEERLQLRSWAINLAGRCAQAGVTASSGAANSLHHPAQRVYREALAFTVFGQTKAVMEATLARLVNKASV